MQQWLKKAETDIKTAETLLDTEVDDYSPCAFHAQQAAEKFIKAYLVRHQVEFRKTHDLDELLELTDLTDTPLSDEIGSCVWLTPYGVEFRYPGEYHEVDLYTAKKAYKEATLFKEAVIKRIEEYISQGRPN